MLEDRKIFAADADLVIIPEKFFNILKVIRYETQDKKKIYDLENADNTVRILDENNAQITVLDSKELSSKTAKIFERIKSKGNKGAFEIPEAFEVMERLYCPSIKAASYNKADIFLVVRDRISATITEQGFSIKSMLGSPSTLLNASSATNFTYQILDSFLKVEDINTIEGSSKVRERAEKIYHAGGTIVFRDVENENFKRNLKKIDTIFPEIMAEILLAYYNKKGKTLAELVSSLEMNSVLVKYGLNKADYEYKVKNFLASVALGMMPNKEWNGLTQAQGGYIIVKENGDLVCYHLYYRDEFQDYLFKNTKLDTPSTGRHEFGKLYELDGKKYFKLNLQIRFIK